MKVCIIGDQSDIAKSLRFLLEVDGHEVHGWNRQGWKTVPKWDLVISALGRVSPVGSWESQADTFTKACFDSNVFLPLHVLKAIWAYRNLGASVCFLAGSNPQKIMFGYTAYNASKMALLKVVEQLEHEESDVKFFALGPGYIDTKIHRPTLESGWPNERIARGNPNSVQQVYDCLKWCISQPKEVIGGRNICVSDPYGPELAEQLKNNSNLYKLRRIE